MRIMSLYTTLSFIHLPSSVDVLRAEHLNTDSVMDCKHAPLHGAVYGQSIVMLLLVL